jgi:hypothetical protein
MKRMLLATLFTLIATTVSFAQTQTQPTTMTNLYLVRVERVKPELMREYRELKQNELIPAYKKGGVTLHSTYTTSLIGEHFEFISVEPVESLKQFDGQGPVVKALGTEGQTALQTKHRRLINSAHNYIVQLRPDLSANVPKPEAPPAKGALAVRLTVAPGRTQDYENYVKADVLPILKKAYPKGVLTAKVMLGGNGNEYRVLVLVDSFDELEQAMMEAVQEGFMKIQPKTAGIILHTENSIVRYVPELSIRPEPQKAAK